MPTDPYLSAALDAVTPTADNVTPALSFALQQCLDSNDPAQCYSPQLIRCAAAATVQEQEAAIIKLKAKYGTEFNKTQWRKLVKTATAELTVRVPTNLLCSDNGNPKAVLANAIIQLRASGLDLAFDSFASKVVIQKPSPWGTSGAWSDRDGGEAANYLQHQNILVGSIVAREAAYLLAHQNQFHPVRDWLTALKWDGKPDPVTGESRLDTWFSRLLGTPDSPLMRAACRKWTISAVGRIMEPGCQADHMIVLEGPEGKLKSSALHALVNGHKRKKGGTQWFRDRMPDIDKKDVELYMQGVWVIEIAELDAIRGKEWTRVNAFISSPQDTFRVPYGHEMMDYPRQCVFAASTNEERWNAAPYGGRRFWPVPVRHVKVNKILEEREQIFAEAMFLYNEGETNFLSDDMEAEMKKEQADRAPDDSWLEVIAEKMALSTDTCISEVLEKIGERRGAANDQHAGRVLLKLGWVSYRPTGTNRTRRYKLPD